MIFNKFWVNRDLQLIKHWPSLQVVFGWPNLEPETGEGWPKFEIDYLRLEKVDWTLN